MSRDKETNKKYGLRRLFNKILQALAKSSLFSGYMRARIQKIRGVKIDNPNYVFIGEDVLFDAISPENIIFSKIVLLYLKILPLSFLYVKGL